MPGLVTGAWKCWQSAVLKSVLCKEASSLGRREGRDLDPRLWSFEESPSILWQQKLPTIENPEGSFGLKCALGLILFYFYFLTKKCKVLFKPTWGLQSGRQSFRKLRGLFLGTYFKRYKRIHISNSPSWLHNSVNIFNHWMLHFK